MGADVDLVRPRELTGYMNSVWKADADVASGFHLFAPIDSAPVSKEPL